MSCAKEVEVEDPEFSVALGFRMSLGQSGIQGILSNVGEGQ